MWGAAEELYSLSTKEILASEDLFLLFFSIYISTLTRQCRELNSHNDNKSNTLCVGFSLYSVALPALHSDYSQTKSNKEIKTNTKTISTPFSGFSSMFTFFSDKFQTRGLPNVDLRKTFIQFDTIQGWDFPASTLNPLQAAVQFGLHARERIKLQWQVEFSVAICFLPSLADNQCAVPGGVIIELQLC